MSVKLKLDDARFEQAMAILAREQEELLPTTWQRRWYKFLNRTLVVALVAMGAFVVISFLEADQAATFQWMALFFLAFVSVASVLPLFLLNIPLMLKLRRHAALRKRIGLGDALRTPFQVERAKGRFRNALTMLMTVVGVLIILVTSAGIAISIEESGLTAAIMGTTFLFLLFFGLGMFSLHFIRRGKERLDVAVQLQETLRDRLASPEDEPAGLDVAPELYSQIAHIERNQIVMDRHASIQKGREDVAETFVVQPSLAAQQAKASLDDAVRLLVQEQIMALMEDPRPVGARLEEDTGLMVLQVPGTPVEVRYLVDDGTRSVRVYAIQSENPDIEGGGGMEG